MRLDDEYLIFCPVHVKQCFLNNIVCRMKVGERSMIIWENVRLNGREND